MFKETKITQDGMIYRKAIVEGFSPPSADKKDRIRYDIENQVFDIHDSLADTTKWVSLLTTVISRMYGTFTETQKAKLSTDDRALIEMMFSEFANTNTRGDVQFAQEGPAMVVKLLARQAKIGELVS